MQDEVLAVLTMHYLSPDQVCGTLLGNSCAMTYNYLSDWNITFPAVPKPPVTPVEPPNVSLPSNVCDTCFLQMGVHNNYNKLFLVSRGGSRTFMGGGGAQKVMCQHAHYELETELAFGRGPGPGGGGGVLRCCLDGGARLKPPNPYPSLRVILAEKGTHY